MFRAIRAVVLIAGCAVITLSGCSAKVNVSTEPMVAKDKFEQGIVEALEKVVGQRPEKVECPGPVKAKAGETARCVLTERDLRIGVTATVTSYENGRARYDVKVDDQPMK
jgi:hypothetical protein